MGELTHMISQSGMKYGLPGIHICRIIQGKQGFYYFTSNCKLNELDAQHSGCVLGHFSFTLMLHQYSMSLTTFITYYMKTYFTAAVINSCQDMWFDFFADVTTYEPCNSNPISKFTLSPGNVMSPGFLANEDYFDNWNCHISIVLASGCVSSSITRPYNNRPSGHFWFCDGSVVVLSNPSQHVPTVP